MRSSPCAALPVRPQSHYAVWSRGQDGAQWFAEWVATFGLIVTIFPASTLRAPQCPGSSAFFTAAYWFTGSTSDAPAFIAAQLAGAIVGTMVCGMGRNLRSHCHDPVRPSLCARLSALARRPLHHGRLLVHRFNVLCQSSGRDRAVFHGHIFRHPPGRRSGVHRSAARRRYLWLSLRRAGSSAERMIGAKR